VFFLTVKELGRTQGGGSSRSGSAEILIGNTRKNSTEVHCVSITLLVSFEWKCKSLKQWRVIGSKVGVQGWGWGGKGEIFRKQVQKEDEGKFKTRTRSADLARRPMPATRVFRLKQIFMFQHLT